MIRVPGGTFDAGEGTLAEHATLPPYCIDKTEVTVAAFSRCAAAGKCVAAPLVMAPRSWTERHGGQITTTHEPDLTFDSQFCNGDRADRQDFPVNCVDWQQAHDFCA